MKRTLALQKELPRRRLRRRFPRILAVCGIRVLATTTVVRKKKIADERAPALLPWRGLWGLAGGRRRKLRADRISWREKKNDVKGLTRQ